MRPPLPTLLGVKALLFYLVLLGAFLAAPYLNLFFLLLTFLTVLGALTCLWSALALAGVRAEVTAFEPTPAGRGAAVRFRIEGRRPLTLELDVAGSGRVRLAAAGAGEGEGRLPPWPRGIHPVTAARISSTWPIGMLRVRRPIPAPEEVVVYPAPADFEERGTGSGGIGGLFRARASRSQPSHLREYRPGDELRKVHWKASARRGEPVVTEWDGGAGSGAEVVLDRRADPETFEEALSLLSALVLAAKEAKETVTFYTQGLSATFGTGHRPLDEALHYLAGVTPLPAAGPPPPPVPPETPRLPARAGGVR